MASCRAVAVHVAEHSVMKKPAGRQREAAAAAEELPFEPDVLRSCNGLCSALSSAKSELRFFPPFYSVVSPIDGKSMESITSVKIFHGSEYKANGKVIRWTEVSASHGAACKPTPGILGAQLKPSLPRTCPPNAPKLKQQLPFPTCKERFGPGLRRVKHPVSDAQLRR